MGKKNNFIEFLSFKSKNLGSSLAVQCLGFSAFTAMSQRSIPGQGAEIPQATWAAKNKKKKLFKNLGNTLPKQGNKAMKI